MVRRVTVRTLPGLVDSRGEAVRKGARDIGVTSVTDARVNDVYLFEGDIPENEIQHITVELLVDFVTQEYFIDTLPETAGLVIEVAYDHGVMDPVEGSIMKAVGDMGIASVETAKTMKRYVIEGDLSPEDIELITDKLLVNKIIQHVAQPDSISLFHRAPALRPGLRRGSIGSRNR